jgi:hypothetical protein
MTAFTGLTTRFYKLVGCDRYSATEAAARAPDESTQQQGDHPAQRRPRLPDHARLGTTAATLSNVVLLLLLPRTMLILHILLTLPLPP